VKAATLVAVLLASAVLAVLELLLEPSYIGPVPVPLGALMALVTLPWLVAAAGELSATPLVAGSPLLVWVVVTGVLGFGGPGGDVLLPATWQTLLLIVVGLLAGLLPLRRIVDRGDRERAAARVGEESVRTG